MKSQGFRLLYVVVLLLAACGENNVLSLGPQKWNELQFVVEARPTPVRTGMNEFIVIATREKGLPGYELIVSIRADDKAEWKQAIQDGYTGVYRRAIRVNNPLSDVLAVSVQYAKKENHTGESKTILYFPLNQQP